MARQRFIWPTIWDDPDLGKLTSDARLLYIGCFSLADDEGRLLADPVYLKTQVFRYRPLTPAKVKTLRDELAKSCSNFRIYKVGGIEYLVFTNWSEFQKPKYPSPSKLPTPPARKRSKQAGSAPEIPGIIPEPLGEASGTIPPRVGRGWVSPPNPREKGTNPRAKGTNPRTRRKRPGKGSFCTEGCGRLAPGVNLEDHLRMTHGLELKP